MKGIECNNEKTKKLIKEQFARYPKGEIQDLFKFIFQSSFGCEHLVLSADKVTDYIKMEYDSLGERQNTCDYDVLDGEYTRIDLGILDSGLTAETLGRLFYLSAKKEENGMAALKEKLDAAQELAEAGELPFDGYALKESIAEWRDKGFPAVHHSDSFRKEYRPAYRVISSRFVPFLPLFAEIDRRLKNGGNVRVAIDGGCGSGKSTLGGMLEAVYGCTLFHMDDFFLRPEQRTAERLAEAGGNVDRERFLDEVLLPLSRGGDIMYRRFDCSSFTVKEPVKVTPKMLTVTEGTYSMHPELCGFYDLSVFLDIDKELQRQRILNRNSPSLAHRFFNEWIPMEDRYFHTFGIKDKCDIVVEIK